MSGYSVLHLDKSPGNESAMTDHIERKVIHPNVDPTRTHLNKELIEFPVGVTNRTEAIQHRIENAGLSRKVGKNQVQVIRVMLTGSHEDMLKIQQEGRLDEWCQDNITWLKKEFGEENLVAATLHLDEKTPHIHASIVPIVQGERRQKKSNKKEEEAPKKKYKKKNPNRPRLCCDDVMSREKLTAYQDNYGEAMAKYGLERGIKGSEARHITTSEFYREQKVESNNLQIDISLLLEQKEAEQKALEVLKQEEQTARQSYKQVEIEKEELKEDVAYLREQKQEVYERVRDMYDRKDEAQDKFLSMHRYTEQKEQEAATVKAHIEQLKQDYEPYKAQDELNLLFEVFPQLIERLRIAQLCKSIGLTINAIKKLFKGESLSVTGKLHSPEHNQSFSIQNDKLQLFKDRDNPNKLKLAINGRDIIDWFRQKYKELQEKMRMKPKQHLDTNKKRGFRM